MSVNPELRSLEIDIPSKPDVLVRLSLLMAEEEVNLAAIAELVETDMALAAAVMKAVNSSLYGLKGRVQTVHQAITYLGTREIAGITFEMGLRAAFPPAPELEPIWARATQRGLLMGRLGQALGQDAWGAHSAGLFEECGKAVLFRHAPDHYRAMLRATHSDAELCELERAGFGVSHDALGAALCESWGLAPAAVASVRHHVAAQAALRAATLPPVGQPAPALPEPPVPAGKRSALALSMLVHAMMHEPGTVDAAAALVAPLAELDTTLLLRAARRIEDQLEAAAEHGR